jgi:hypothetical protein
MVFPGLYGRGSRTCGGVPDTSRIFVQSGRRPRRTLDDILTDVIVNIRAVPVG